MNMNNLNNNNKSKLKKEYIKFKKLLQLVIQVKQKTIKNVIENIKYQFNIVMNKVKIEEEL